VQMTEIAKTARTIDETPLRAMRFLYGIASSDSIRAALSAEGYGAEDHSEGWTLLTRVCRYHRPHGTAEARQKRAWAALAEWGQLAKRRLEVALRRRHPEIATWIFENLPAKPGQRAAILAGKLESLERRAAGSEADRAALETLNRRGLGPEERARAHALLSSVSQGAEPASKPEISNEDRDALRAWFVEWSTVARHSITRRDHLIQLGLVRKARATALRQRISSRP